MKRKFWTLLIVVFLLAGMEMAFAQSKTSLTFSVAFPFKIGETTFPAGSYQLVYAGANTRNLQIVNKKTRETQFIRYTTRLSARPDGNVVFDSYKQERYLSEVYMGGADGFQIQVVPEEHSHEVAELKSENP